jgi:hypothetical protein
MAKHTENVNGTVSALGGKPGLKDWIPNQKMMSGHQ